MKEFIFGVSSLINPISSLVDEVNPTYFFRSVGMTIADAFIYLWAFTVTYNSTGMRHAMTNTGLFVGFYGGISLFGVIFLVLFLPELKGKTLEEVDVIFSQPMSEIARANLRSSINTFKKLFTGRWKEIVQTDSQVLDI